MRCFFVSGGSSGGGGGFADYEFAESKGVSTTTSKNYLQKLRLTTSDLDPGTYRIGWSYSWNIDSTVSDFLARIQINDSGTYLLHQQEAKDNTGSYESTGTDQKHKASGFFIETLSGVNTIDLDWANNGPPGVESSIWDARIEIWRIV